MKKIVSISALALVLSACDSGDAPTEYVFDLQSLKENPKKYTAGSTNPKATLGCMFSSVLLLKENLKSVFAGEKPDLGAAKTPARIKVYEDKIEWVDIGSSPIKNNKTTLASTRGKNITFNIERRDGSFSFVFKEDGMVCKLPFKKVEG